MPAFFSLNKILKEGVEYRTTRRQGYVIRKIGTNSSGNARIDVDGKKLSVINSSVAPLHVTSSNLLGPLDLKDCYIVVPPNTKFSFTGDSGSKMRVVGEAVLLEVGESFPSEYLSRFGEQHDRFRTLYEASFSLGTDETWKNGIAYEVMSLTPLTTERITLDDVVLVNITGDTVSEGDFAVEFYMDNTPFEPEFAENLYAGIDALSMPSPPRDDTEELVFTLKDYPIVVNGDHTLSIRVRNVSGSDKAPASGSSWTVNVKVIAKYERVGS